MAIEIPRLGLGTYTDDDQEGRYDAVKTALDVGYRHIDTAESYRNEAYVGRGIADSPVDREDVFLASKTVNGEDPGDPDAVYDAIEDRLDELDVDYLDLSFFEERIPAFTPGVNPTTTTQPPSIAVRIFNANPRH